jgi:hypothetical protein
MLIAERTIEEFLWYWKKNAHAFHFSQVQKIWLRIDKKDFVAKDLVNNRYCNLIKSKKKGNLLENKFFKYSFYNKITLMPAC